MKSHVLVKIESDSKTWIATAYHRTGVWCSLRAQSRSEVLTQIESEIEKRLTTDAAEWVTLSSDGGSSDSPNCPEGAIRLPIDLWVCKLFDETCPIQAQVFLSNPQTFFQGCLATPEKKRQIFDTVIARKYRGFHHLAGRIPCPLCDTEGKGNLSYCYPWELADLENYSSVVVMRDWPGLRPLLPLKYRNLSTLTTPLCASHARLLALTLDPALSDKLVVLEFEFHRQL
jgi:hypothetical protein